MNNDTDWAEEAYECFIKNADPDTEVKQVPRIDGTDYGKTCKEGSCMSQNTNDTSDKVLEETIPKMKSQLELDDALSVLTEIATGDRERDAICIVKESVYGLRYEADTYRSLYEGLQKKLALYRDIASRPDIHENKNWENGNRDKGKK